MVAKRVKTTLAITGIGSLASVAAVTFLVVGGTCEETAEAGEFFEERRERRQAEARVERERILQDEEERSRRLDERLADRPERLEVQPVPAPRVRKVRRWVWESPAETRSKLWNVPQTEDTVTTATGLLRICMTEADGHEDDCIAIWQVLNNIRSRSCDRQRVRRITECDEDGETLLSVMRRAQRFALGVVPPRSRRTRWIASLELTCEQPESYPGDARGWVRQYGRSCGNTSTLVQRLVVGQNVQPVIRGARAIAWGGRCESRGGACDDPIACSRGLIRIRGLSTLNAFWRRPRTPDEIEPVCRELGFGRQPVGDEVAQADAERPEVGEI